MSKPRYHHGNLRAALVQAGLDILHEKGLAGLTLRACAARAGVSHAAPKNHFANLAALLAAIAAEGFRQHAERMRAMMRVAKFDPQSQILAAFDGYLQFAQKNPDLFRLMFSTDRQGDLYPELVEAADLFYDILRQISTRVELDQGTGPAPRTTAEAMLWSFIHGYTSLVINDQFGRAIQETGSVPSLSEIIPRMQSSQQ